MDDWQLLQSYVERDSETAFRTLVNRYVSLVYSVALRQVRNTQLAEEVAQAVFILLARKARGFRQSVVLSGWLFRTTRFVASRAVRGEQRRQHREHEAFAMQQLTTDDDAWRRIWPALDEALEHLGETDRNAVLLRFFDDKSHRETAAALGISEDAAKKRVTRALDKLRDFFAGRGVTLSATVLASAVAANAAKAATPEIAASVSAKVIAGGSTAAGALPPLVSQTLNAWRWMRLKIAGAVGITALTAAFLFHSMTSQHPGPTQSVQTEKARTALTAPAATDAKPSAPDQAASRPANLETTNTMLFRALDAQTSVGIAGAKVAVNYVSEAKWWAGDDLITDAQGICSIPIPSDLGRLDVCILKDGYVQKFYTWRRDSGESLPSVYILKTERGVSIGGLVRNESGQPISDAEIVVQFHETSDATFREPRPERLGFIRDLIATKTDAKGRWKCAVVPAGYDLFNLEVRHPQFATTTLVVAAADRQYVTGPPSLTMKDLLASEAIAVMRSGFRLAGVVLDDTGQPLAEATVSFFANSGFPAESRTTKADGFFSLAGLAAGATHLGASATGFAPASQTIDVQSNVANLVFRLDRGTTVSIRVVDEQGNSISGAWVAAEGSLRHNANWHATSDAEGWARIEGIPEGVRSSLRFHAGAKEFFMSRDQRVDLSAPEPTLHLRRTLKVSGRVTDAGSGEAIAWFKAIPCRSEGVAGYDRSERKFGTNGDFSVTFSEFQPPFRVRIEADDYEPALSPPIPLEPREQSIELKLHRKDPSKAIRGMVLLPDGQPAVGADVALLTFERGAGITQGRFMRRGADSILTHTDFEGKFQFDPDANAHTVAAAHLLGFGRIRIGEDAQTVVVQLAPWGRIDGRVRTRDGKWSGREVVLTSPHSEAGFWVSFAAKSDAEGSFSLESVPAGDYTLHLNPGVGAAFTDATPVEVRAGETAKVQIGGSGATVTGRLEFAGGGSVDWAKQAKFPSLQPKADPPPAPRLSPMDSRSNDLAERRKRLDLVESEEWRAWARVQRPGVTLKIAADGSFVAEGVRAGEYTLSVALAADAVESSGNPMASMRRPTIASIRQPVMVSDGQEQAGELLDLGALVLQPEVLRQR